MYTEDDKKSKSKRTSVKKEKPPKTALVVNNNPNDEYDYYQDYYNNAYDSSSTSTISYKDSSIKVNDIDTSYTDDYSDGTTYDLSPQDVFKKKYIVIIILLVIALSVLIIILVKTINVKSPPEAQTTNYIRLFHQELELHIGESQKLDVTLSETNAENYQIQWFSNDDSVATVDANGNVQAVGEGEAIILVAYAVDGKTYDAQCIVRVSK